MRAERLIALAIILVLAGCGLLRDQPIFVEERRPGSVPPDATYVKGALGGWWQRCTSTSDAEVSCQIYNWKAGSSLYDEVFLPYDQQGPILQSDLTIKTESPLSGPDRIVLQNGRILIPMSRYAVVREFLNRTIGENPGR
jgi:hypothetical protein